MLSAWSDTLSARADIGSVMAGTLSAPSDTLYPAADTA
jgi:hypothetical protein